MTLLIVGLVLWTVAHWLKRLTPDLRVRLDSLLGPGPARGIVALAIGVALLCIIVGFRSTPFVPFYDPPAWTIHLNNLLMLIAVGLVGASHSKGRVRSALRHPMLMGVLVWAIAHLLVNGDTASIVLFGWMGVWAVLSMVIINNREPAWIAPAPGPASADLRLVAITLVTFAVIAAIHTWLGYWPFPQ